MNPRLTSLLFAAAIAAATFAGGCGQDPHAVAVPGHPTATKTSATHRAERRLFDGAPPVIPHQDFGAACLSCHKTGMAVPDVGYAPVVPHDNVEIPGLMSRCRQCHVHVNADDEFTENDFVGLAQDLRKGERLFPTAPPVMPHPKLLRENCLACHDGPAAREEIRCSHPERVRCTQCHAEQVVETVFTR